ncbi:hypothetical protein BP6252_05998 [Coleophoma cylindrospora]|uniref:Uncharacterized protein n=1 Tax=Coleophoma cylindrospora TaxID=1849047 RepID=A0A3D8RLP4_9HELO|nr:hypothetical protein BP6252_05998 [Coleophoma cylindrospora]
MSPPRPEMAPFPVEHLSHHSRIQGVAHSATTLMTIPREVRNRILEEVLLQPTIALPNLDTVENLLKERIELPPQGLTAWSTKDAKFPHSPCRIHPIFLVNQQLNEEASATANLLPSNYVLDVILYQEVYLLPTWIVMPKLIQSADILTCNFRIAGSCGGPVQHYSGFGGGDGAGPISWIIYSLFERLIYYGPWWKATGKEDEQKRFIIRQLEVNIMTPPGIQPESFGPPQSSGNPHRGKNKTAMVLSPMYLFDFIRQYIWILLNMQNNWANYGHLLYENVGRIVFKLDGEVKSDVDVAEVLHKLNNTCPDDASLSRRQLAEAFQDWKPRVMAKRKSLGLSVAGMDDSEDADLEYKSFAQCHNDARVRG